MLAASCTEGRRHVGGGRPQLALAPGHRELDARRELIQELNRCFRARTAAEWEPLLREADVWHHTVSDVNDVIGDEQANAVGAFADIGGPHPVLAHPVKWSGARTEPRGRAPALGADTEAVLAKLGMGKARL